MRLLTLILLSVLLIGVNHVTLAQDSECDAGDSAYYVGWATPTIQLGRMPPPSPVTTARWS
jgi:hypothetical protein